MSREYLYYLKHKDDICALLTIDDKETGTLIKGTILNDRIAPMGSLNVWWQARAVPSTREDMKTVIRQAGAENPETYLAKNLALSMTDAYWICPFEEAATLKWNDICLTNHKYLNKPFVPYHNSDSYDANATLGGQMEKYWDLSEDPPVLVKKAYKSFGQQGVNEQFATLLHSRQPNAPEYVSYIAKQNPDDLGLIVACKTFIEPGLEFVPAHQIRLANKDKWTSESLSDYDRVVKGWASLGMSEEMVRNFLDYQTITDFIITNIDRHYSNFGALRNVDTLEFVKPAPIFDSGNSMLYDERVRTLTKADLLKFKVTSIYHTEEQMLKRVQNRKIVDLDALPSKDETIALYTSFGIKEERAAFIADAYQQKIEMVHTFQKGTPISMYRNRNFAEDRTAAVKSETPAISGNGERNYQNLFSSMQQEAKQNNSSEPDIEPSVP